MILRNTYHILRNAIIKIYLYFNYLSMKNEEIRINFYNARNPYIK